MLSPVPRHCTVRLHHIAAVNESSAESQLDSPLCVSAMATEAIKDQLPRLCY